jgi:hypothetical protein
MSYNPLKEFSDVEERSFDRPMGITLIAVLLAVGGGLSLISQLLNFSSLNGASDLLSVPIIMLQASIAFVSVTGLAAAAGLWSGKRWGWWLALFYFAYAITRNANALLSIQWLDGAANLTKSYYMQYGFRIAWNIFLMYCLCAENATQYFKNEDTLKWRALLIVFGICAVIFTVFTLMDNRLW